MAELNGEKTAAKTIAGTKSGTKSAKVLIPRRYVIAVTHFFGFCCVSALRVNMSFAIVAMTSNRSSIDVNGTETYDRDFDWNSKEQGMILGSFFYGYVTTQLIGGVLAPMVGAGRLFGICIFLSAVLNMMTPSLAQLGSLPLVAVRTVLGVVMGPVTPVTSSFWSHWAPSQESTKLLGITFSGVHIGTCLTMALCGVITEQFGWPWIFYFFGGASFLWCFIWFRLISEDPSLDKTISPEELKYLTDNIQRVETPKLRDVPWRDIFTSIPLWTVMLSHMATNYVYYTMLTQLPTYLNDVTDLDMKNMGMLSGIPNLTSALTLQLTGYVGDTLRSRYNFDTTKVRKTFTCGAHLVQMTFLLLTPYADSVGTIILFLSITVGMQGCSMAV